VTEVGEVSVTKGDWARVGCPRQSIFDRITAEQAPKRGDSIGFGLQHKRWDSALEPQSLAKSWSSEEENLIARQEPEPVCGLGK
jgi:hypothetical protein